VSRAKSWLTSVNLATPTTLSWQGQLIQTTTAPIWQNLPEEDVAAATRVLNELVTRARAVLASGRFTPVSAKNA
jgi:hypothetical protein